MKKIDIWRWIERVILIGGIVGLYVSKKVDKAKMSFEREQWRTTINNLTENDKIQDEFIINQGKINEKSNLVFDLFLQHWGISGTSEEDEEGN